MGIDIYSAKFLRSEVKQGLNLGRMLTLGHQAVYMDRAVYRALIVSLGISPQEMVFADDFFRGLGTKSMDVLDASNYEGANVLHNLSEPATPDLIEKYDCVFDGGTLEHVFNFPVALKNCLEMVKVGGHFISITPANAQCGHGFYQFSPELFYNALSAQNGFSVKRLLFEYHNRWYSIKNPTEIKERVELFTDEPTQLYILAMRVEKKVIFANWPQQSDYNLAWNERKPTTPPAEIDSTFKEKLLQTSSLLRNLQTRWRKYKRKQKCRPSNQNWFTLVEID